MVVGFNRRNVIPSAVGINARLTLAGREAHAPPNCLLRSIEILSAVAPGSPAWLCRTTHAAGEKKFDRNWQRRHNSRLKASYRIFSEVSSASGPPPGPTSARDTDETVEPGSSVGAVRRHPCG